MVTPRQERTGVAPPEATGGNVAKAGPMPDLSGLMRQAKRLGESRTSASGLHRPPDQGVRDWDAGAVVREPGS